MNFLLQVDSARESGEITEKIATILRNFTFTYKDALEQQGYRIGDYEPILMQFLDMVIDQLKNPFSFTPYHQRIIDPINYYQFGMDFLRPLIIFSESKVIGIKYVEQIIAQLSAGENVVLFANHQTEPDPHVISLLLEKTHPKFAEEMISVAGHRVTTDPLAAPLSKGRNLLCIYSKKHIENPPEEKHNKLMYNQKTMQTMGKLLAEGGKCIYVAPSGGRDRPDEKGNIDVAPFDPQSIEMFRLIARHAKKPTHFYPLALATYNLLPPPNSVEKELGEQRHARCTPVHIAFDAEIDMDCFPGSESPDKHEQRISRAKHIWSLVQKSYAQLI